MFKNNKIIYGLVALLVGVAMSFSTVNAQVTETEEDQQRATTQSSINGKVVDASTGQPLSDVTVQVEGQDQEATTDENGQFTLSDLQSEASAGEMGETMESGGEITLTVDHEGYKSFSKTVNPSDWAQQARQGAEAQAGGEEDMLTLELEPEEGGEGDYESDF